MLVASPSNLIFEQTHVFRDQNVRPSIPTSQVEVLRQRHAAGESDWHCFPLCLETSGKATFVEMFDDAERTS